MTLKLKLHNLVLSKSDKIKQSHFMFNSYKAPRKIAGLQQATTPLCYYSYRLKKIRLDVSCESSARQRIRMKYQVLFSLKKQ